MDGWDEGSRLAAAPPAWAAELFAEPLVVRVATPDGVPRVWQLEANESGATIGDQFTASADEYHRRYGASDYFVGLFRQAFDATGLSPGESPLVLDLGSGSGVNSVIPCRRLFPGARVVATDLSVELLAMLAELVAAQGRSEVICVQLDAMSEHVRAGAFDVVTGAAILHHLTRPEQALRAAARALRPGGLAFFFEPFVGWSILQLAYERILAEAALRREPLDRHVEQALRALATDIATRCRLDRDEAAIAALDDKWLFSRTQVEEMAHAAGFSAIRIVAHNEHAGLFPATAAVQLRLRSGRAENPLPPWALEVLDRFDSSLNHYAKREFLLEGTIVLTR